MSQYRREITADHLNEISKGKLPELLDIVMTRVEQGSLKCRMTIQQHHLAINGYLHAGSIVTLADTACGNAAEAHLPDGSSSFTTIELKSNFLGTTKAGTVSCIATAQHLGRRTQVWDATVIDDATKKTIAIFRCTQMIL